MDGFFKRRRNVKGLKGLKVASLMHSQLQMPLPVLLSLFI